MEQVHIIKREVSDWRQPTNLDSVQVIAREEISGITEMNVEGVDTYLGEVKNFKNNAYLKNKLPKDLSISWTRMPAERELPEHFHPCSSLIVVTKGFGQSTGDTIAPIQSGDVVHIPEWNSHGFQGKGAYGFHALSIQFQETAIFDSEATPETTYQKENVPLEEKQLHIVSRDQLNSIHEVFVDGQKESLGTLKNFSEDSVLNEKFPKYLSMAWVRLKDKEVLKTHVHDTDSMIIVTEGSGHLMGDLNRELKEGDLVYVPAGSHHGFIGEGEGFWGLSIQFNETSLYENPEKPQVQFINEFEKLVSTNNQFAKQFTQNPVFKIDREELLSNPNKRKALLDGLQVMSNHFQRLMFARMALCDSETYHPLFLEHFLEELGHDTSLAAERQSKNTIWDPSLDAYASWFVGKNYLIDNPGRIVMIQMVLEKGASIFYSHFANILAGGHESEHIAKHCEADEGHDSMGVDLLQAESPAKLKDVSKLQSQSWDMLNHFLRRLAQRVQQA